MDNAAFQQMVQMESVFAGAVQVGGATEFKPVEFQNRNRLLDENSSYYLPGANGVKTGYTSSAGSCLVASAQRDGRHLIAVVLNSSSTGVWQDAIRLIEYGFKH